MKINIKNARRLETEIDNELSHVAYKLTSKSGSFATLDEARIFTEASVEESLKNIEKLNELKYHVRNEVGKFNHEKGINDITLDIAKFQSHLETSTKVSEFGYPSLNNSIYRDASTSYCSGISSEVMEKHRMECKVLARKIQRLKDKCVGINSTGTIELNDEQVKFAKSLGMMDS